MRLSVFLFSTVLVGGCICTIPFTSPGSAASSGLTHAPRIKLKPSSSTTQNSYGWASSNWSGYALSGSAGQYNSITGSWIVPAVQPSHGSTYSSSWIGIDGFNNSDLIQTGTEQDYYSGSAHYDAWWEILPAAETVIPNMTIQPGDHMTASIKNDGNGDWTITLNDVTENESFTTTQAYSGPAESAEWIQEAPTIGGHVATLANYGETTFDPGTVNGSNPNFVTSDGGVMIQNRQQVSTPSVPDSDTDGFNIAYGSTAPAAPAS
ncbi:hypothetical protein BM613_11985 [Sulfoacidibacillus thermotolerans]|uniref:Peptidase A4 family protein n=2 Tax=Sulfoacidibacillus thermotolerans TaxID=1765684 RepID=A0A2U3D695_SULT2|nr:hypothetical protein BM613_11985 [Sulfoacidibacillus thermotolerans]